MRMGENGGSSEFGLKHASSNDKACTLSYHVTFHNRPIVTEHSRMSAGWIRLRWSVPAELVLSGVDSRSESETPRCWAFLACTQGK